MNFFANVVKNLNIEINVCDKNKCDTKGTIDDPVLKAIEKNEKHPRIEAAKNISKNNSFSY